MQFVVRVLDRVVAGETAQAGGIISRPQVVVVEVGIVIFPREEVVGGEFTGMVDAFAEGAIVVGLDDRAACVCQRAGAAQPIIEEVGDVPLSQNGPLSPTFLQRRTSPLAGGRECRLAPPDLRVEVVAELVPGLNHTRIVRDFKQGLAVAREVVRIDQEVRTTEVVTTGTFRLCDARAGVAKNAELALSAPRGSTPHGNHR